MKQILSLPDLSRGICGRETCPSSGRAHIQGTLVFKRAKRFAGVKAILADAHWEPCQNLAKSWEYCAKEGHADSVDNRERPSNGVSKLVSLVREGATDTDLVEEEPALFARYHTFVDRLRSLDARRTPRDRPRTVIWIYGETGVGKTRWAYDRFPGLDTVEIHGGRFFAGYRGSPVVLFDDIRESTLPFRMWLRLMDRYPLTIDTKGSEKVWSPDVVIVTTSRAPDGTFGIGEDIRQLTRRISHLYEFPRDLDLANVEHSSLEELGFVADNMEV